MPRAASSGNAAGFQRAQIIDRGWRCAKASSCASEPPASWMMRPSATAKRPAKALARQIRGTTPATLRQLAPRHGARARARQAADRIDAGAQIDRRRRELAALHQRGEMSAPALRVGGLRLKSMVMPASSSTPSSARSSVVRRGIEAVAVGVERAGEHQRQPGRAVFQILQRLRIGRRRIGMIDPLHQRPGRARRAPGDRLGARRARIERLDAQAVIGLADQPLVERGALERRLDQLAPVRLAGRREIRRRGEGRRSSAQIATVGAVPPLS